MNMTRVAENNMDLVYFELNNWSYFYYPNVEPFVSWIQNQVFCDDEWCKKNELAVNVGEVDMSLDFAIVATKEWVEQNCPDLLSDKKYTFITDRQREMRISDFVHEPDKDGTVYGSFVDFPEYTEENFGVHWVESEDDE